jgi:hypothetical protein
MNFGTPQEMYDDNEQQNPNENKQFGCITLILLIILISIVIHNENS